MGIIEVKSASKSFGNSPDEMNHVLKDINLTLSEGEFVAIVGYSGSGKTTLMSMLSGLIQPDTGVVLSNGEEVTSPSPDRAIVFQNYSLLPWMSVYDNIDLAVSQVFPELSPDARDKHVLKYIELVNLLPAVNKKPSELSGGMRQRVSLARSLSMEPSVLLMDEPLSALDALTRGTLQKEICQIWEKNKKSVVLITNDVDEGILMADRILPLTCGPNATLGPDFKIDIPRPRTKKGLTNHPEYQKLRKEIVQFLMESKNSSHVHVQKDMVLPDIEPEDLTHGVTYTLKGKRPIRKSEVRSEHLDIS